MTSIRAHYVSDGVADYYRSNYYENPHEERVNNLFWFCLREIMGQKVKLVLSDSSESSPTATRSEDSMTTQLDTPTLRKELESVHASEGGNLIGNNHGDIDNVIDSNTLYFKSPSDSAVLSLTDSDKWHVNFDLNCTTTTEFRFLDFSAGNGEVTNAFLEFLEKEMGFKNDASHANTGKSNKNSKSKSNVKATQKKSSKHSGPHGVNQNLSDSLSTFINQTLRRSEQHRNIRLFASDPFTHEAFQRRFHNCLSCAPLSFEDIVAENSVYSEWMESMLNKSDSNSNPSESTCGPPIITLAVCSYALHLADPKQILPMLARKLSGFIEYFLILTPHKRPILKEEWGWKQIGKDVVLERTRGRLYRSTMVSETFDDIG